MINVNYTRHEGYKINSLGYRAPEFDTIDWDNSYVIQGCSAVFGLGLSHDDDTVSNNLSMLINHPVINLGVSGTGMMMQHMNLISMLEKNVKPKGVFILYPNMDRYPLFTKKGIINVGPWSDRELLSWMDDDNSRTHNLYHMRSYRLLLKANDIPLYEASHHGSNRDFCKCLFTDYYNEYLDYGHDNAHWGPITSKFVANLFFNQIK
jgi:hypothetical protein